MAVFCNYEIDSVNITLGYYSGSNSDNIIVLDESSKTEESIMEVELCLAI